MSCASTFTGNAAVSGSGARASIELAKTDMSLTPIASRIQAENYSGMERVEESDCSEQKLGID
jgi:hypothetical protein